MRNNLEIADIAPHLFILHLRNNQGRRLSVQTIAAYGEAVASCMGKGTILVLSRAETNAFMEANTDVFVMEGENIVLKDGVNEETLRRRFCNRLTVKLAKALAAVDRSRIF